MGGNAQESAHCYTLKFAKAARLASLMAAATALVWAQSLPLEPLHEAGASVTGAFEGWYKNADGSYNLLLGYFNRNLKQDLDIPIGPDNRIEPGGPDRGQPTHFLAGRQWGMFSIKVPADFGTQKLTWTIVANGQNTIIPAGLNPDYEISPFEEAAVHNTPPVLRFEERGPSVQGPRGLTAERTAKVGVPLSLTVWASDDAKLTTSSGAPPRNLGPPVVLRWSKYRGPGQVSFNAERPEIEKLESKEAAFSGKAVVTATFSEPGQYVLQVVANDYSGEGGGGFQCCWTHAQVSVLVQR
ncbi:MAG: hypothetical protein C5B51_29935 [Terriglobia bacterium]|nr:MAG: hypothetical protein C5B51_29935 [Terriglobia bacterium]